MLYPCQRAMIKNSYINKYYDSHEEFMWRYYRCDVANVNLRISDFMSMLDLLEIPPDTQENYIKTCCKEHCEYLKEEMLDGNK